MGMADSIAESPINEIVFVLRNLSSWKILLDEKRLLSWARIKILTLKDLKINVRRAFEPERHIFKLKGYPPAISGGNINSYR